jgi:hypothetical protein
VELRTTRDARVTATPIRARGAVSHAEAPTKANDRTAKILLDVDAALGAAWYEVAIEWE